MASDFILAEKMADSRRVRGWSAAELARQAVIVAAEVGEELRLTQQAVSQFENKKLKSVPRWVRFAQAALDVRGLEPWARAEELTRRFGRYRATADTPAAEPPVPAAMPFQFVTMQVALPPEGALARMFEGLLRMVPVDASRDEVALLLARRLPTALPQVRDLLPSSADLVPTEATRTIPAPARQS